jgi:hypothetical protein
MPELTFREELIKTGQAILDKIGVIATTKYMKQSGSPTPDKLTNRTGKTKEALLGGVGGIRKITFGDNQMKLVYGVDTSIMKGMRLLEDGGTSTEKQRRYFWFRYYTENDSMMKGVWKSMAIGENGSGEHHFQSRQTIQSAVRDVYAEAKGLFETSTYRFIQTSIRRIIDDNNARNNRRS